LRTEIAWSCDLLEPDEKRLFRRLAVFPGGCALEAAEVVCREPRALDLMASLVDKNLVRRQRADGCERFRMLETIREFASEQLEESNEAAETRRQFTGWALHVAEDAERGLFGAEQIRCFDRLEAERDNLGEALALLYAQRRAGEGTQLSGAMGWFWFRRGHFTLGAYWLERFLAIRDATVEPAVSARAEYYLGYMRLMLGRTFSGNTAAGECFRKSLELWREARNTHREAWQRI
jgi:predicted ATPase